jgi:hypothetical protein
MDEMSSQNMSVQTLTDLPCSGPVTHPGETLTTGKSHRKKPDRFSLKDDTDVKKVEGADMTVSPHFGASRCVHDMLCRCWSRCVQEEKRGEHLDRDNCSVLYCKYLTRNFSSN